MNTIVGQVSAPYMEDARGARSTQIEVMLTPLGGGEYELTYTPDDDWMGSRHRSYPVTLDPTVTFTSSVSKHMEDNYVSSVEQDRNFTYNSAELRASSVYTMYIRPVIVEELLSKGDRVLVQDFYLHMYGKSGSGANSIYLVTGDWNSRTITKSTAPGNSPKILKPACGTGWNDIEVSRYASAWFDVLNQKANHGFCMSSDGDMVYASADSVNNRMHYSVTYYVIDEASGLTATPQANGDGTGYVDLTWNAVGGATGYYVGVFNGREYEYIYVGNVTSWSTNNQGIWPTAEEIAAGRYQLHLDGAGAELAATPTGVYRNAGGAYGDSLRYYFSVLPANRFGHAANPWDDVSAVMPHALRPAQASSVQASPSAWTAADRLTVSWSGIVDYLADGTELTTLESGGRIEYSIDGVDNWTSTGKATASGSFTLDISSLSDGEHGIYLRGRDKDGNEGAPLGTTFKIDRTAPTKPTVSIDPAGWTNAENALLTWDGIFEAHSGLARVEYAVDDGSWRDTASVLAGDSITLPLSSYADGTHTVKLRAADVTGNVGATGSAIFQKDTTAPTVDGFSASPAAWTADDTVRIAWSNLQDAQSGLAALSYSVDNGPPQPLDHTQTAGSVSIDAFAMVDGTHAVTFHYEDAAGNTGTETVQIFRDTTPPEVVMSQPASGDIVNGVVMVTGTVRDLQALDQWSLTATGAQSGTKTVAKGTGNIVDGLLGVLNTGAFADGEEIAIVLHAADAAGHTASTQGVVVKVDKSVANVVADITITAPANGAVVNTPVIDAAYTGGAENGHVYIDGVERQTANGRSFAVPVIECIDGTGHTITVISETADGTLCYSDGLGALVIGSDATQHTSGTMNSGVLNSPKNILALQLNTTQSADTGIDFSYSIDGGSDWVPITPGKDVRLTEQAKSVQLRAELEGTSILYGWELSAIIEKSPVTATVRLSKAVEKFTITHGSTLTQGPRETISTDLTETGAQTRFLYANDTLVNSKGFDYETLLTPENGSATLTALALDDTGTVYGSGNASVVPLVRAAVDSAELVVETGALTAAQPIYAVRILPYATGSGCRYYISTDNITWTEAKADEYSFLNAAASTIYLKAEQRSANQLQSWLIEGIAATGTGFNVQLVEPPMGIVARDYGAYSDKRYELSWTGSTTAGVEYVVYKNGTQLTTTTGTTFTDNAYTSGATYTVSARKSYTAPDNDATHTHYPVRESEAVAASMRRVAAPASGTLSGHSLIDFSDKKVLREQYGDTYLFTLDMVTPPESVKLDQKLLGRSGYCALGFEPVNFNTGNFLLETRDYWQAGIGLPLELLRTYNSDSTLEDGPFGAKWAFPYAQHLELYRDGNIGYRASDGALTVFEPTGYGTYRGNDDD